MRARARPGPYDEAMGRGQGATRAQAAQRPSFRDPSQGLSAGQESILALLREGGANEWRGLRDCGLRPAQIRDALDDLEARGLVTRMFNGNGPNEPWYFQVAWRRPEGFEEPVIEKGQVWDWAEKVWLEVKAGRNAYGLPRVMVKAGLNNQHDTALPLHYFGKIVHLREAEGKGTYTEFSKGFLCPVHGVATEEMVRTDKCCAKCGTLLIRI